MADAGVIGSPYCWGDNLSDISATKKYPLGTIRTTINGDEYVYVKAGAVNLAAGCAVTYITTPTAEDTVTVAHAIGTTVVTVTDASSTEDAFEDGYLIVDEGTAVGECYRIKSNAASNGTTVAHTLYEGLRTAWSTSDTDVSVYPNPYNAVVVCPTDAQQKAVGVPQWPITAAYYGWILKRGYGSLIFDVDAASGTEVDEKCIIQSTGTAGYGQLLVTPANFPGKHILGWLVDEADISNAKAALAFIDL